MNHVFRIEPLDRAAFEPLFILSDAELASRGMKRVIADEKPGYPCRVSLVDAEPGETLVLLHHMHHEVPGPYRASGPIYVREQARTTTLADGEVPEAVRRRLLSLRAYDASGLLQSADVVEGTELEAHIERMFADPGVAYLHAHHARPGCFSCRIVRAGAA